VERFRMKSCRIIRNMDPCK